MASRKVKCPNCRKKFTPRKRNKIEQKYCSRKCFYDTRYGKTDPNTSSRNPLYSEVIELCRGGFTKSGAAKHLGIPVQTVHDWFRKYKQEQIFSERTCQYCGKSLLGMTNLSGRKYCSDKCSAKAIYLRKNPQYSQYRYKHNKEVCAAAMELYWGGLGGRDISQRLGVSEGTVYSWIHDFGNRKEREKTDKIEPLKSPKQRFHEAKTDASWLKVLSDMTYDNGINTECSNIYLVCGTVRGQCGINTFVTIIFDKLKCNPCSGEIFVFCDTLCHTITKLKWTGTEFCTTKISRQRGKYLWPNKKLGLSIKVTELEFNYLISYQKKRGKIPGNT